jgi:hypothetical protein
MIDGRLNRSTARNLALGAVGVVERRSFRLSFCQPVLVPLRWRACRGRCSNAIGKAQAASGGSWPKRSFGRQKGQRVKTDNQEMVDVRQLIEKYSIEELNEAADEYFSRLGNWDRLLAKPFGSSNDAIHLLVQLSYLLQGLDLYPGMKVLDFGCGPGWTSRLLNQMGFEVISLDVSPTALRIAGELATRHPVFGQQPPQRFLQFDGRRIDLPAESEPVHEIPG